MEKILQILYGENYDIVEVVNKLLEPRGEAELEAYNKLCDGLTNEQKRLFDTYLHLYNERIFRMQNDRFNAGFNAGLSIKSNADDED